MKKFSAQKSTLLLIAFIFVSLFSFNLSAYSQKWEKLGERKVNFKTDRDEIGVGRFEGFFNALRLKVTKGSINMEKMVVHFHNGDTKEITLKENFPEGGVSRVIDLPGNRRIIDKVVFWYETTSGGDTKAELELWGRHWR